MWSLTSFFVQVTAAGFPLPARGSPRPPHTTHRIRCSGCSTLEKIRTNIMTCLRNVQTWWSFWWRGYSTTTRGQSRWFIHRTTRGQIPNITILGPIGNKCQLRENVVLIIAMPAGNLLIPVWSSWVSTENDEWISANLSNVGYNILILLPINDTGCVKLSPPKIMVMERSLNSLTLDIMA